MRKLDLRRRPRFCRRTAKSIKIYQSGITQKKTWGVEVRHPNVRISSKSSWRNDYDEGQPIKISFCHPSKGGGETDIIMLIPENTFQMICEVMFDASPNEAKKAFLSLLTKEAKFLDRRKSKKTIRKKSKVSRVG